MKTAIGVTLLFLLSFGGAYATDRDEPLCESLVTDNLIPFPQKPSKGSTDRQTHRRTADTRSLVSSGFSHLLPPSTIVSLDEESLDNPKPVPISLHHRLVQIQRHSHTRMFGRYIVLPRNTFVSPVIYTSLVEIEDLIWDFTERLKPDKGQDSESWIQDFSVFLTGRLVIHPVVARRIASEFHRAKDGIPAGQVHLLRRIMKNQLSLVGTVLVTYDRNGKSLR